MSALKVLDLQRFVRSLLEPLGAAGVSAAAQAELSRLATCLEPFQGATLGAFGDFLIHAQTAVQTGQWPAPTAKAPAARAPRQPKAPKLTLEELAQKTQEIYDRAATDTTLDFAAIDSFVAGLSSLTKPQLAALAPRVDVTPASKDKKDQILEKMKESIQRRKERGARTSYGSEGA